MLRKKTGLLLFAAGLSYYGMSQTLPAPKVESPNATSLDKFGDVPVNLFTGTPDISIPVHTLQYGNISVPITLRYHPGSVRVAQHPGWVGLGWDLESIGAITRTVRDYPDEAWIPGTPTGDGGLNGAITYYPTGMNGTPDSQSGSAWVNTDNWNTAAANLKSYYFNTPNHNPPFTVLDAEADEFSFNFMGYSGKFYYSGPTLGWQVVSDENISVLVTDYLYGADLAGAVNTYQEFIDQGYSLSYTQATQPRMFKNFVLTVPDGTKYFFGGVNAIEMTSPYNVSTSQIGFAVNTWLLNKIIDVNNNEVDFTYRRSYPTCSLGFNAMNTAFIGSPTGSGFLDRCGITEAGYNGTIDANALTGSYIWPMYLSKITSPNETVTFNGSPAVCLRYSNNQLMYPDGVVGSFPFDLSFLNPNKSQQNVPGCLNYLQWEQLNNIIITNSNQAIYRQFDLGYSSSLSQRLTLTSFTESDNQNNAIAGYTFAYNNVSALPLYTGNFSDHWGFYNAKNIDQQQISNILTNNLKSTDISNVKAGLLSQINYPTGGYTNFSWEAHDYSQIVSPDRQSLLSANGYAGGSRIIEIQSVLPDGTVSMDKKYIYKRNYKYGTDPGSLTSSGILNGSPQYVFAFVNRPTLNGTASLSYSFASLNSTTNYSYNGQGSYLGYDEVAEVNADGSYTRHFFTSYGADINGISHKDNLPAGYIGWIPGTSNYTDSYLPMSTLEGERGKSIGIFDYSSNNTLVQKTVYTFRNDAGRFNNFIKLIDFGGSFSCTSYDALIFASARDAYTYSYYPVNKAVTTYDQQGNNPVVQSESYTYNQNNLVSTKTEINSKGENTVTNYKYPTDYTDATSQAMVAAHILSPVIETSVLTNGSPVSLTHINYYSPSAGLYTPQNVQVQIGGNTIETRKQFYNYDIHGNLLEQSRINDPAHEVYLWGYHSQYLVAKIVGSTYATVSSYINQSQLDAAVTDAQMTGYLSGLRNALSPTALVTTYTYMPLTGMTSQTDPRGQKTTYQYDSFQRLSSITDNDGNIIKTFKYQYQQ
jgi:YD repeat-containing protein